MPVSGVVVEIEEGTSEAVFHSLAQIDSISVFGVKDTQIVVVIEADAIGIIEERVKEMSAITHVTGVYPVFSAEDE